jgi:hypothetical protein
MGSEGKTGQMHEGVHWLFGQASMSRYTQEMELNGKCIVCYNADTELHRKTTIRYSLLQRLFDLVSCVVR